MPLEPYLRGDIWWFRGRIDDLPASRYYRQSTGASDEGKARRILAAFEARELKRHYAGTEKALTFAEAVLLYTPRADMIADLERVLPELGERALATITPEEVRQLGQTLFPKGACDYWHRHVVTPVRAVINNAHALKGTPPIKVKAYSRAERVRQDQARGRQSRRKKTPGSWEWLLSFKAHAGPYLGAMAHFMFVTAARIGQATALAPGDLDLQNARVWMPAAKGVEAQWVPIPMDLVVVLANLPPRRPRDRRDGNRKLSPRVFGYAGRSGVYGPWKRACKAAGIEHIPPHAAGRHGFGTEMIVRQGIDAPSVAAEGRWADVPNLLRTYAHPENSRARIQAALRTGRVQAENEEGVKPRREQAK